MKAYKVLGLCDDVSTCEFCGKTELQRVVAFSEVETGEVLYAGTTCAETVKLIVLDETTGEAVERTANQIMTIARRKAREQELSESLERAAWAVAELVMSWRDSLGTSTDEDLTSWASGGYELRILHGDRNGQVLLPMPASFEGRAAARGLVLNWALRVYRIQELKSVGVALQHASRLHEWIEAYRLNVAVRLAVKRAA